MSRLVTHADITAVPDGGVLSLPPDARLTPLAAERVKARGITVQHGAGDRGGGGGEGLVQEVTRQVVSRLAPQGPAGPSLDPRTIDRVVTEVLLAVSETPTENQPDRVPASLEYCATVLEQEKSRARRRAVITTTGRNARGIVARFTTAIADLGGDILDISQTLVGDYFTMILIVDTITLVSSFADFKTAIEQVASDLKVQALVMHEDLVTSLNRV